MKICSLVIISLLYIAQAHTEFSTINAATNKCDRYYCKSSSQSFTKGQCGLREINSSDGRYNVYASPICSEKETCTIEAVDGNTTTYTCLKNDVVTGYKWPGEKCDNNDMCNPTYSGGCKDGKCLGSGDQDECINHNYCLPGYYCLGYNTTTKGTCQKQIEANGHDCSEDYDCVNNAWCNMTNVQTKNLCFTFGSFSEHAYVNTCENNQNFLCSSGYCFSRSTNHHQCSTNLTSAQPNSLPNACDVEGQFCQSTPDEYFSADAFIQTLCTCAYNEAGSLYCPLFYGDGPAIQYTTQLKKWLNSKESQKCNTVRRTSAVCIKDFWDSDNYNKLVYYSAYYEYFPNIQGAETCVLETFLYEFYEVEKAYHDSAEILIVTALIASLF